MRASVSHDASQIESNLYYELEYNDIGDITNYFRLPSAPQASRRPEVLLHVVSRFVDTCGGVLQSLQKVCLALK